MQNFLTEPMARESESRQGLIEHGAAITLDEANAERLSSEQFEPPSYLLESEEEPATRRGRCCSSFYIWELLEVYDNKFLLALGLQYLNTGMKAMTTLAFLDLFRTQYGLEPAETQSLTAAMTLSWTPKLFYGIISDTFPIFGTRKKSYIILMGMLQFATAWTIAMVSFSNPIFVCILGFFMNLASAFMDVVVDGLMVMQARRDTANGSQNLQTFSWQLLGLGGIIGGVAGGVIT